MKRVIILMMMMPSLGWAQNLQDVLKRGEEVFNQSCTGYCHAPKGGGGGGAPRLVARGFDQAYINTILTRGIPGTTMPAFAMTLPRTDFAAVVAYLASLNGIANPIIGGAGPAAPLPSTARTLSPAAARGRDLFFDATRSFGRCATCHEVTGMGIPVATPITNVPATVAALRALTTPQVATASMAGETMPALVLSKGSRNVIFYDLTTPPPVLVTAEPAAVKIVDGSNWRHSSVINSYKDPELESILNFLRAVIGAQ